VSSVFGVGLLGLHHWSVGSWPEMAMANSLRYVVGIIHVVIDFGHCPSQVYLLVPFLFGGLNSSWRRAELHAVTETEFPGFSGGS